MNLLKSTTIALAIVAATSSSAYARDYYSVGINVGNYGYPAAYSSNYSAGYSNYYAPPNVVYYGAPVVHYQPVVRYVPVNVYGGHQYYQSGHHGYRGYHNNGYRGHHERGHDFGRHGYRNGHR